MKTDQLLKVTLPCDITVECFHKSMMVDLTQLWLQAREVAGKRSADLSRWLTSDRVKAFVEETSKLTGIPEEELVQVRRVGRAKHLWAHVNIAIAAMSYLSPRVHAIVVDEFVRNRLLQFRDEGGDNFIEMNFMLASKAEEILGKPAHKGHYITLANIIRKRVGVESWNMAPASAHRERARIEEALTTMLKAGVVRDWDHLKELAEIV